VDVAAIGALVDEVGGPDAAALFVVLGVDEREAIRESTGFEKAIGHSVSRRVEVLASDRPSDATDRDLGRGWTRPAAGRGDRGKSGDRHSAECGISPHRSPQ
jgi:hypothetical protein